MDPQEIWEDYQHLEREVTKLRGTEQRLKVVQARYTSLFGSADGFFAVIDREGVFLDINPAGLEMLERNAGDVIGRNIVDVFPDAGGRAIGPRAAEAIQDEKGITLRFDWTVSRVNSPALLFSTRLAPVRDETGRPVAAFLSARDITELASLDTSLESIMDEVSRLRDRVSRALEQARREPPSEEAAVSPPTRR